MIPRRFRFSFMTGEKHPAESTAEESDDEPLEEGALDEDLVGDLDLLPLEGALNEELDVFLGALLVKSLSTGGEVSDVEGIVGRS